MKVEHQARGVAPDAGQEPGAAVICSERAEPAGGGGHHLPVRVARGLCLAVVLDAVELALRNRRPATGVMDHPDRGSQDTSLAFGSRCRRAGITLPIGSPGDCYDNAMAESFFATLE